MSKYLEVETQFTDLEALKAAFAEWAAETGKVFEFHEKPQHLFGYQNDQRSQKANLIVRRKHVGSMANDVGFVVQDDGTIKALISEYDRRLGGEKIMEYISEAYAEHAVIAQARAKGLTVARQWRDEVTNERMVQFAGYT